MTKDKLLPVEQVDLLPCPFCGAEHEHLRDCDTLPAGAAWVSCDKCECEGPPRCDRDEARIAWNTRHRLRTAPAAGVERVVAAASDAIGACQLALADGRSADRKRFASDWLETAKGRVAKAIEAALATPASDTGQEFPAIEAQ